MITVLPPRFVRPLGAIVGAALASAILVLLYVAAGSLTVESVLHVRFVLGPDGFLPGAGSLGLILAWSAGPVAAAASGWLFAVATARREPWTGPWMGLVTYFLALLLASLVPDLTRAIDGQAPWGQSIFEAVVGAPIMAVMAGGVLAPLFFCCVLAGVAWAWIVRRFIASVPTEPRANTLLGGFAGPGLILIGSLTVLGWIAFSSMFAFWTGDGGQFID